MSTKYGKLLGYRGFRVVGAGDGSHEIDEEAELDPDYCTKVFVTFAPVKSTVQDWPDRFEVNGHRVRIISRPNELKRDVVWITTWKDAV